MPRKKAAARPSSDGDRAQLQRALKESLSAVASSAALGAYQRDEAAFVTPADKIERKRRAAGTGDLDAVLPTGLYLRGALMVRLSEQLLESTVGHLHLIDEADKATALVTTTRMLETDIRSGYQRDRAVQAVHRMWAAMFGFERAQRVHVLLLLIEHASQLRERHQALELAGLPDPPRAGAVRWWKAPHGWGRLVQSRFALFFPDAAVRLDLRLLQEAVTTWREKTRPKKDSGRRSKWVVAAALAKAIGHAADPETLQRMWRRERQRFEAADLRVIAGSPKGGHE